MSKRLKHNLLVWFIYTLGSYIVLMPLQIWIPAISYSILLGFFFGFLNDVIIQLRKLNGEKFNNLKEDE